MMNTLKKHKHTIVTVGLALAVGIVASVVTKSVVSIKYNDTIFNMNLVAEEIGVLDQLIAYQDSVL